MKGFLLILLLLLITSIAICQNFIKGKVVRVVDVDTITILGEDNTQIKIRLYGIDCPKSHQGFGIIAKNLRQIIAFKSGEG